TLYRQQPKLYMQELLSSARVDGHLCTCSDTCGLLEHDYLEASGLENLKEPLFSLVKKIKVLGVSAHATPESEPLETTVNILLDCKPNIDILLNLALELKEHGKFSEGTFDGHWIKDSEGRAIRLEGVIKELLWLKAMIAELETNPSAFNTSNI
ncbi:MAG: hypothetical protein WC797_03720, partial [Candidatus Paceibacterota bacterium]